jgi:gluconate 2-dehydrogenase gamma chain
MYFNDVEARTVEAIAERLIPGDGNDAGATDAGVVYYIDRTIAGFSLGLQRVYRLGLRELATFCSEQFGLPFVDLSAKQQDLVVELWLGPPTGEPRPGFLFGPEDQDREVDGAAMTSTSVDRELVRRLFRVIREHTVEGYFCDPVYGGNRNAVGWRLVGFPGAYWGYTAAQMKSGFDGRSLAIKTLSDLRADLHTNSVPPNEHFTNNGED